MAYNQPLIDTLMCKLCCESYNYTVRLPRVLSCQHTFCQRCLALHSLNNGTCPLCDASVDLESISKVPLNHTVIDIMQGLTSQQNIQCKEHVDRDCIIVCMDCLQGLCIACVQDSAVVRHRHHQVEEPVKARTLLLEQLQSISRNQIKRLEQEASGSALNLSVVSYTIKRRIEEAATKMISPVEEWKEQELMNLAERKQYFIDNIEQQASMEVECEQSVLREHYHTFHEIVDKIEEKQRMKDNEPMISMEMINELKTIKVDHFQDTMTELVKESLSIFKPYRGLNTPNMETSTSKVDHQPKPNMQTVPDKVDENQSQIPLLQTGVKNEISPYLTEEKCRLRLLDNSRNCSFSKVVHSQQTDNQRLVCRSDDFLFVYNMERNTSTVHGLWETSTEKNIAFEVLNTLEDIQNEVKYQIYLAHAKLSFKNVICCIRSGGFVLNWPYVKDYQCD